MFEYSLTKCFQEILVRFFPIMAKRNSTPSSLHNESFRIVDRNSDTYLKFIR